jgi:hypothetical protein
MKISKASRKIQVTCPLHIKMLLVNSRWNKKRRRGEARKGGRVMWVRGSLLGLL